MANKLSQRQMIHQLAGGTNAPFMYFKENGNFERTYVKYKLRSKNKNATEIRLNKSV